jgi:hypothetical protein
MRRGFPSVGASSSSTRDNTLLYGRTCSFNACAMRVFWCSSENRLLPNQKTEAKIRGKILNHFTKLGLPEYQAKNP